MSRITFSPRGRINPNTERFDWENALIDAAIMAALTFFTSLAGMGLIEVSSPNNLIAASISAAIQFFTILALKRGLIREGEE